MKYLFRTMLSLILGAALSLATGCASIQNRNVELPVFDGRMELVSGVIDSRDIQQPATEVLTRGSAFLFSPVEFAGHKVKLGLEEITSPLGQNVALRQAGEGLLRDIKPGQARTFDVRYQVAFGSIQEARERFRNLPDKYFVETSTNGKKSVDITHWSFRFVMLFSNDRKAFRVLIDNIQYYHPTPVSDAEDQNELAGKVPVLISFAYLYPDSEQRRMKQTNIVFDYLINLDENQFAGKSQFSNWIPLQDYPDSAPFSIEIAVAEIRKKEEFFRKITEWVKSVRGLL